MVVSEGDARGPHEHEKTRHWSGAPPAKTCLHPIGQALVMFHNTVTGAFSQPTTLLRAAPGPYHWPSQPYCAVSSARFCTAAARALALPGSVSFDYASPTFSTSASFA